MPSQLVAAETTAEIIQRDEIDLQIRTAKTYPRDLDVAVIRVIHAAKRSREIAARCFYSLPARDNSGRPIRGGSIHFATLLAYAFGNMRCGSRVIDISARTLTAQGVCHDLENNTSVTKQVDRSIMTSAGARYKDNMIQVTAQAAESIALRNAILSVIPEPITQPILTEIREYALGDESILLQRMRDAIAYFGKQGVDRSAILASLDIDDEIHATIDHLGTLLGFQTALADGQSTLQELFALPASEAQQYRVADNIAQQASRARRRRPSRATLGNAPIVPAESADTAAPASSEARDEPNEPEAPLTTTADVAANLEQSDEPRQDDMLSEPTEDAVPASTVSEGAAEAIADHARRETEKRNGESENLDATDPVLELMRALNKAQSVEQINDIQRRIEELPADKQGVARQHARNRVKELVNH